MASLPRDDPEFDPSFDAEAAIRYQIGAGYVLPNGTTSRAFRIAAHVHRLGWAATKDLLDARWSRIEAELMAEMVTRILDREDELRSRYRRVSYGG